MTQNGSKPLASDPLILALLSNTSVRSAAAAAGISEATAWRRLSERDFCESLQAAKYQAYSHALTRLQTAACEAVSVLVEVAGDSEAPPRDRLKAAEAILSHADATLSPPLSSDAGRRLAAGDTSEPSVDALLFGR